MGLYDGGANEICSRAATKHATTPVPLGVGRNHHYTTNNYYKSKSSRIKFGITQFDMASKQSTNTIIKKTLFDAPTLKKNHT